MLIECKVLQASEDLRGNVSSLDPQLGLTLRVPLVGAHQGQPRVQALWGAGAAGQPWERHKRKDRSKLAAPAPHSAPSLWPLAPPSSSPSSTRGSSPGEERNDRSREEPVPGPAGRRGRHGWECYALSHGITPAAARGNWICESLILPSP